MSAKSSGRGLSTLTSCNPDTNRGCGGEPAWSPGGRRIAYTGEGGLRIVAADGGGDRAVGADGSSPAWSPSGGRLAFKRRGSGIAVIDTDGTDLTRLTSNDADARPAWSRAGVIAFVRSRDAGNDIMTMTASGTRLRRLVQNCNCGHLDFSPDGRWLAYSAGALSQIYVIRSDGSARRRLTHEDGDNPVWSPSGRHIAYIRTGALYTMRADGTGERLVLPAPDGGDYDAPSWQPLPR